MELMHFTLLQHLARSTTRCHSLPSAVFTVNSLLDQLKSSGHGVSIDKIYCAAPMYADDLALISESEVDLHHMLAIGSNYALLWGYHLLLSLPYWFLANPQFH